MPEPQRPKCPACGFAMVSETTALDWRERIYECINCGHKMKGRDLDPWGEKSDKRGAVSERGGASSKSSMA